jgi:uncharacterized protein
MRWRNGSGTTLEIAREPPGGDDFLWRLSLATIAASGPFSSFPGYRRSVTLLSGGGFRLDSAARPPVTLDVAGATISFPGDASTHCSLIDGPCSDLSLLVREPGAIGPVRRLRGAASLVVPLPASTLGAVFCLGGGALLVTAGCPIELATNDTLLLRPQVGAVSVRPSSSMPLDLLLLSWSAADAAPA